MTITPTGHWQADVTTCRHCPNDLLHSVSRQTGICRRCAAGSTPATKEHAP